MLLIAQRVVTADSEGINAYQHLHGAREDWSMQPPADIPDGDPGALYSRMVTVTGRGRVVAYLDLAAPDDYPTTELEWALRAVDELMRLDPVLPLCITSGPLLVRFEVEKQRLSGWREELRTLFAACMRLLEGDE